MLVLGVTLFFNSQIEVYMKRDSSEFFDNLMTMDELLAMLRGQYSRHTVYKWCREDQIPYHKIRGKLWFPKVEVTEWFKRSG